MLLALARQFAIMVRAPSHHGSARRAPHPPAGPRSAMAAHAGDQHEVDLVHGTLVKVIAQTHGLLAHVVRFPLMAFHA